MSLARKLARIVLWQLKIAWRRLEALTQSSLDAHTLHNVPYYGQFESPHLIDQFLDQTLPVREDPLWKISGAKSEVEYENWAWHVCGMACLKMSLAHATGKLWPTVDLGKGCEQYGGYVRQDDGQIDQVGLRYAGFVAYVQNVHGWKARIASPLIFSDIQQALSKNHYVIASVNPAISSGAEPKTTGGHLVLIIGYNRVAQTVTYHDPSGRVGKREDCVMSWLSFNRYFAQRGIIFHP